MGRRLKYDNDEDRQNAIRQSKTRYMLGKSWVCDVCEHDYSLAGKHSHIRTKKHIYNTLLKAIEDVDDFELINE